MLATHHISDLLVGAGVLGAIAHAVNTFPTPANKYGAWLLGLVQFMVGQRVAAANTMQGKDTIAAGVPQGEGKVMAALAKGEGQKQ